MNRTSALLLALLVANGSELAGQRFLVAGDTVRVRIAGDSRTHQGVVTSADTIGVGMNATDGSTPRFLGSSMVRLQVLAGRKPGTGRGAAWGAGIGIVLGTVLGVASVVSDVGQFFGGSAEHVLGTAVLGAGAGLFTGVVVGSVARVQRWVPGQLPQLSPGPSSTGAVRIAPMIRSAPNSRVAVGLRLGW